MKIELNNPKKIKIPFNILYGDKIHDPYSKLGYYLQSVLDTKSQINVSKIWINNETQAKFDELLLEYIMKKDKCGKKSAKVKLGWWNLMSSPANDIVNEWSLKTDYIYVEEDYENIPD